MKMSCFMEMYGKVCRGYINILVNISEPDNEDERWGLWYEEGCVCIFSAKVALSSLDSGV